MSKKSSNRKALNLLERLVQDQGETTPEQQALLDNLIMKNGGEKFYKKENGKYVPTNSMKNHQPSANNQRLSRSRTKNVKTSEKKQNAQNVSQGENQTSVAPKISVPDARENPKSRSSSRSSSSSFWTNGYSSKPEKQTRSRSRSKSKSRSRSSSRSRSDSRSRSRSYSSSSSRSRSRSRTRSRSSSRSNSRSRSRSESKSRSLSSRSRSRSTEPSHSTVQSVPAKSSDLHVRLNDRDTMSDIGQGSRKPPSGRRRRKLAKRSQIKKFRSLEIDPNVFIEERLQQKYRELDEIIKGSHFKTSTVTRQHLGQMQKLREQYHMVSHGIAPPGVLVPRSLPTSLRNKNNSFGSGTRKRPMSGSSYNSELSGFSADPAYGTLQNIMNANSAQEKHLLKPIRKSKKSTKKKDKKQKDNDSTLDNLSFDLNKVGGSESNTASTPRSMTKAEREEHHIKMSENPKLLEWLKEKDKMHRKKRREEKAKKREEREKVVLEANERFEKRLEAQKIYDKWLCDKNVEISKQKKVERKERKKHRMEKESQKNNEITVRSKSASLNRRDKSGGIRVEGNSETNINIKKEKDATQTVNGNATNEVTPHPPASKFMYKRPVAGRIKLRISNSASGNRPDRPQSASSSDQKKNESKMRMSYDEWVLRKRKQDELKKEMERKSKEEQMSRSDPELNKIIPDIAKKRIHNVLEGKKRIDTGIRKIDEKLNKKFGGKDFKVSDGDSSARDSGDEQVRYSYRLESDHVTDSKDKTADKLNVSGKAINRPPGSNRPQTAPAGGNRVPPPKQSSGSPRKAVVPAKVEDVMSNEDRSNPFKLPFPEDQGVPKHVAARQRKIFADRVWAKLEDEERPEPQGSDIPEPPLCVASNTTQEDEDDTLDESGLSESNEAHDDSNVNNGSRSTESKEQTEGDDESKVFLTQFNSTDNLANITKSEESEDRNLGDVNVSQNLVESKEKVSDEVKVQTESKCTAEAANVSAKGSESSTSDSKSDSGNTEVDSSNSKVNTDTVRTETNYLNVDAEKQIPSQETMTADLETDGDQEKTESNENAKDSLNVGDQSPRPESANTSRSNKRVSFCEDPQVFGLEQEDQEWSTDTQTPDEDNAMYTTNVDSGDPYDRYEQDQEEVDTFRSADSLDDDF